MFPNPSPPPMGTELSRLPPKNLPANIRIHIAYIKQTCSSGCHAEYHQHYSRAKHMTKGNRLLLSLSYCSKSFRLRIHAVPNKVAFCTTPIFAWTCNFSNHFSHFFVTEPSAPITSEPHLKISSLRSYQLLFSGPGISLLSEFRFRYI